MARNRRTHALSKNDTAEQKVRFILVMLCPYYTE